MGCDIHIVIQRWDGDRWNDLSQEGAPDVFDNRNYDLFGILADVRNGTGFAGIQTGEGWPSIAPRRGLPEDFELDDHSVGEHSFTWMTLEELQAFSWDVTSTTLYGVGTEAQYQVFLQTKEPPDSYCGSISGPGIKIYLPEEYESAKQKGNLAPKPYVRMAWCETAREATYDWPGKIFPWLETLAEGRTLRLVIGFDSRQGRM